mgnify:CR=1 FL=1
MAYAIGFALATLAVTSICWARGGSVRDVSIVIFAVWFLCFGARMMEWPVPEAYVLIDGMAATILLRYERCWLSVTIAASLFAQCALHAYGLWFGEFQVAANNAIFATQLMTLLIGAVWSVYGGRLFPNVDKVGPWTLLRRQLPD